MKRKLFRDITLRIVRIYLRLNLVTDMMQNVLVLKFYCTLNKDKIIKRIFVCNKERPIPD